MYPYKLSIIVPTYNLEKHISNTFNSIKSQTIGFENIELIFVDNNSTDSTFSILQNYDEKYDNVKVFKTHKTNAYIGKAKNIGLNESKSKYVLFLNGRYQILKGACDILLKNMISNDCDIIIGSHINCYENGKQEYKSLSSFGKNELVKDVGNLELLDIPDISGILFKKELLNKNNIMFVDDIPEAESIFLIESILNSNKIHLLNNYYVYYKYIPSNSISLYLNENYFQGLIESYCILCLLFEMHSVDFKIQKKIFHKYLNFFTIQILQCLNLNQSNKNMLKQIMISESFNYLSNKQVFRNDDVFEEYFKYMYDGEYRIAKEILDKICLNNNYSLKNQIKSLKTSYENLNEDYFTLKTNYNNLNERFNYINSQLYDLKIEFNNIKSHEKELKKRNDTLTEQIGELQDINNVLTQQIKGVYDKNSGLIEQNDKLNVMLLETKDEFNNVKIETEKIIKSNKYLEKENNNLKNELNRIKSTKLWKLKNRF